MDHKNHKRNILKKLLSKKGKLTAEDLRKIQQEDEGKIDLTGKVPSPFRYLKNKVGSRISKGIKSMLKFPGGAIEKEMRSEEAKDEGYRRDAEEVGYRTSHLRNSVKNKLRRGKRVPKGAPLPKK